MTNKDKALNAFKSQLEAVDSINTKTQGQIWRSITFDIIEKFLGKESNLLIHVNSSYSIFSDKWQIEHDRYTARDIVKKCIEYVELMGVEEPMPIVKASDIESVKTNFISRMSEGWAIFWAGILILGVGTFGFFVGDYTAKNKVEEWKIASGDTIRRLKSEKLFLMKQLTKKPSQKEAAQAKTTNKK